MTPPRPATSPYAAVFIDFENIYYFLKNHFHDPPDLDDHVLSLVRGLREHLATEGLDCLVMNAYADWERIPTTPQGNLYLLGVNTRNVLGTAHKNAADMKLCIDALEVLYTRPDIGAFVLVAGDRDYIPVLQHLRQQARQVRVTGFRESVSGDLLLLLGEQHFVDARDLLGEATMTALEQRRTDHEARLEASRHLRERGTVGVPTAAALAARTGTPAEAADATNKVVHVGPVPAAPRPVVPAASRPPARPLIDEVPPAPFPTGRLSRDVERRTLAYILQEFRKLEDKQQRTVSELWLGPFMRILTDKLPELPDWERRDLLNKLRDAGTVRIEKRDGEPHPFSVIVVNNNHPDVWEQMPGEEVS